jgi:hypothetical protein
MSYPSFRAGQTMSYPSFRAGSAACDELANPFRDARAISVALRGLGYVSQLARDCSTVKPEQEKRDSVDTIMRDFV